MRAVFRKLFKSGGIVAIVWTLLRALWDVFGHASTAQWLWDIVKDWPIYLKYAAVVVGSTWFPLVLSILCLVGWWWLVRKEKGDVPLRRANLTELKEPQPVVVTINELKSSLNEGERLVGRFQEDSSKPTFGEVDNWLTKTRNYARQNALANHVTPKDLAKFEKPWDEDEVLGITVKFSVHGCFADGSTQVTVFQHLWGHVQRLKELIAKIEGEELTEEKELRLSLHFNESHGESPQLRERRQKLKNLLAKKEKLAGAISSEGFDMDAARRRNEKFIAEVRDDITRLENEQSKRP